MIEMKIFLAKFISRFRIVNIPETKVEVEKGDLFMTVYNEMIVQLDERVWNKDQLNMIETFSLKALVMLSQIFFD